MSYNLGVTTGKIDVIVTIWSQRIDLTDASLSKQYGITLLDSFPYIGEGRLNEKICVKYPAGGGIYGIFLWITP